MSPYDIAKQELGVSEFAGPANNPQILRYHQATSLKADDEGIPWCSAFVCWCVDKARATGWKGAESTHKANARSWLSWGTSSIKDPKEGDIVILSRGSSKAQGHIGFYVQTTKAGLFVKLLGGNQGDSVCYSEFPRWRILDIRRGGYEL